MSDVYVSGVPVNRAVLVRHTPNEHQGGMARGSKGAIAINQKAIGKAIDYVGRFGKYQDKGDIFREATPQDQYLLDNNKAMNTASFSLDYIGRTGRFETKGAEHQLDASLWDQYGPISKEAVEREMISAGGAFIDSIVTVKREYAEQLGLATKQDFESLIRNTWVNNVEKWGLIQNREDIRWVAAYHTDAKQSLHVHIYTWSAKGEIDEGATVGKVATRQGKELILDRAYAHIKQDRNLRASFLRDLGVLQVKNEMGIEIADSQKEAINLRAKLEGHEERFLDIRRTDSQKLSKLNKALQKELENGYGRLANNYKAQAKAHEILKEIRESNPDIEKIINEYKDMSRAKAIMKGLSLEKDPKAIASYVNSERDDLYKRMCNQIVAANKPKLEQQNSQEQSERIKERKLAAEARKKKEEEHQQRVLTGMSNTMLRAENVVSVKYGTPLKSIRTINRMSAQVAAEVTFNNTRKYEDLTPKAQRLIKEQVDLTMKTAPVKHDLKTAAKLLSEVSGLDETVAYEEVCKKYTEVSTQLVFETSQEQAKSLDYSKLSDRETLHSSSYSQGNELLGAELLQGAFASLGSVEDSSGRRRALRHSHNKDVENNRNLKIGH